MEHAAFEEVNVSGNSEALVGASREAADFSVPTNAISGAVEPVVIKPPPPVAETSNAETFFVEGESFLRGSGAQMDESRAIANFLNASDNGHAGGAFKAALMYFTGTGITRNLEEASALARRCLELGAPSAMAERACNDMLTESLGTANALRLLKEREEVLIQSAHEQVKRNKNLVFAGAGVAILAVVSAVAAFLFMQAQNHLDEPPVGGISTVISAEERDHSKKEALASIAKLKADAAGVAQALAAENVPPRTQDF